jgi:lipoprotein-anchoring transpeptidase ErfK/SrfK
LLRQLCAVYVVAAGIYGGIAAVNARPDLAENLRAFAARAPQSGAQAVNDATHWLETKGSSAVRGAIAWLVEKKGEVATRRHSVQEPGVLPAPLVSAPIHSEPSAETPAPSLVALPNRVHISVGRLSPKTLQPRAPRISSVSRARPDPDAVTIAGAIPGSRAPAAKSQSIPDLEPPGADEVARARERLRINLSAELFKNFDLFLYVSKAERGPLAQRMYVFAKRENGELSLLHAWPVSTGRQERALTKMGWRYALETPTGYFQLDPNRFHVRYVSNEWGLPMPHAMFFNWVRNGAPTGFAIHGVTGEAIAFLGKKASAGCVRLAPEHAAQLFELIRKNYRGHVPRFATDIKTGTMNRDGLLWYDRNGRLKMTDGYRVLVFIENYSGEDVVAALF